MQIKIHEWRINLEVVYFTLMAASLYFVSDWALDRIEISRGERFKNRNIIFFLIILVLALMSGGFIKFVMMASEVSP